MDATREVRRADLELTAETPSRADLCKKTVICHRYVAVVLLRRWQQRLPNKIKAELVRWSKVVRVAGLQGQ